MPTTTRGSAGTAGLARKRQWLKFDGANTVIDVWAMMLRIKSNKREDTSAEMIVRGYSYLGIPSDRS